MAGDPQIEAIWKQIGKNLETFTLAVLTDNKDLAARMRAEVHDLIDAGLDRTQRNANIARREHGE